MPAQPIAGLGPRDGVTGQPEGAAQRRVQPVGDGEPRGGDAGELDAVRDHPGRPGGCVEPLHAELVGAGTEGGRQGEAPDAEAVAPAEERVARRPGAR